MQDDAKDEDALDRECNKYLECPCIRSSEDPLEWWKDNETKYPHLAGLAKKYLSIPASTAPSERAFSIASKILDKGRYRMKPERLCKLIFMKHNIRSLGL
jgi:hypothetical protein